MTAAAAGVAGVAGVAGGLDEEGAGEEEDGEDAGVLAVALVPMSSVLMLPLVVVLLVVVAVAAALAAAARIERASCCCLLRQVVNVQPMMALALPVASQPS